MTDMTDTNLKRSEDCDLLICTLQHELDCARAELARLRERLMLPPVGDPPVDDEAFDTDPYADSEWAAPREGSRVSGSTDARHRVSDDFDWAFTRLTGG